VKEATVLIGGERAEEDDDEAILGQFLTLTLPRTLTLTLFILESSGEEDSMGESDSSSSENAASYFTSRIMPKSAIPSNSIPGIDSSLKVKAENIQISSTSSSASASASYEDEDDDDEVLLP